MDDAGVRSEGREFFARVTLLTDIPLNNQKTNPKILPPHSQISIMADNLTDAHCQNHLTTRVSRKKKRKKFVCPRAVTAIQKITRLHQQRFSDKEK